MSEWEREGEKWGRKVRKRKEGIMCGRREEQTGSQEGSGIMEAAMMSWEVVVLVSFHGRHGAPHYSLVVMITMCTHTPSTHTPHDLQSMALGLGNPTLPPKPVDPWDNEPKYTEYWVRPSQ